MTKQGLIIAVLVVITGLFFLGASPLFIVDITQTRLWSNSGSLFAISLSLGSMQNCRLFKRSSTLISVCWTTTQRRRM
jgi:hypothetical protein